MKISIVQGAFLPVPPLMGGAVEKAWYALGRDFAAKGHQVLHVGRSHPELSQEETDAGVRYRRVEGYQTPASMLRLKWLDLRYSLRALRALPEADILVTNTFWLPLLARSRRKGLPYVHVARYPKGQLRHYPARCVLQTVSSPILAAMKDELGTRERRLTLVPYPLSPSYLVEKQPASEKVFLYTGRVHPEKGLELLIRAFRRAAPQLPGWSVRVIGPWKTAQGGAGERFLAELQTLANGLPVHFEGPLFNEQKLVEAYQSAPIFVYPSQAERGETFGLSVLEAMGAGCCPIVSSLACFQDFVKNGENGLIFDHRSTHAETALADCLLNAAGEDERRERLRNRAWQDARNYALPLISQRYLDDFLRFLKT